MQLRLPQPAEAAGMTSQDVVAWARVQLGRSASATWDPRPAAAGVLASSLGGRHGSSINAARQKGISGRDRFGLQTDTLDAEGQSSPPARWRLTASEVRVLLTR